MNKLKFGIMGGTFNPIHNGHLIVANHVLSEYPLNGITFIPVNIPTDKDKFALAKHRYDMVKLAINENDQFSISDVEIKRGGPSYTIDTIKHLIDKCGYYDWYFIIGTDAFFRIKTWDGYEELLNLCSFIVINRRTNGNMPTDKIKSYYNSFIRTLNKGFKNISFMQVPSLEISSSYIRERVLNNKSIHYLVPDKIADYIKRYKLYTS